jgi:hypothetical protein
VQWRIGGEARHQLAHAAGRARLDDVEPALLAIDRAAGVTLLKQSDLPPPAHQHQRIAAGEV